MMTQVKVKCVSKKDSINWNKDYPISTAIEMEVPYDQSSVFYKLSGGTNFTLNTVNQEAAKMFEIGKDYQVLVTPWEAGEGSTN